MIAEEQLRELYQLYEGFHGALNPLDPKVLATEQAFYEKLQSLHATHAPDLPFHEFRRYAVQKCKEFIRKN